MLVLSIYIVIIILSLQMQNLTGMTRTQNFVTIVYECYRSKFAINIQNTTSFTTIVSYHRISILLYVRIVVYNINLSI